MTGSGDDMLSRRRSRRPIGRVHLALAALVAAAAAVAFLERKPSLLDDFDSVRDAPFASTWRKRLHIAYWEKWGSFEAEACQAMVDAFNRSQDEVFVHYIRTSQVDRKAMLAAMGGDAPEVVGLWASNVPNFADSGALMPLDGLMERSGLPRERYIPSYLALGECGGVECEPGRQGGAAALRRVTPGRARRKGVYALPTTPSSVALFWNKEHFREKAGALREAGLDPERPPRTTEELDRYAAVLNEFDASGKPLRMGFLPTEPGWFDWTWGFYFGGRLFDEERGLVTADDPANVEALLWTKRYAERYGRTRLLQFRSGFGNFDSPQNAFIEGRVSMEMQGVWFPNFIRRHRPHLEFGVAPFPAAPGVPGPVSLVDADVIAIPRGCRHVEAAWRFVEFSQREGLAIICRLQGKHMPVREPPANFREGHPNLEIAVFEAVAASPHAFIQPRTRVWGEYQHELDKAFEHVWNWAPPEEPLAGLDGRAREEAVQRLCRGEVERTLGDVRERIQRRLDEMNARERLREEGAP